MCHNECASLCKKKQKIADSPDSKNFYGLTDDEIRFCEENKVACLKAYKSSWEAEKICLEIYPLSDVNDESDACRHYVWSILMARDIDEKNAETVLNAHENNSKEPKNQRAMDLANNRLGLLNFSKNRKGFSTADEIKKSFLEELSKNKFIIIKPMYQKTGGKP